MTLPTSGALSLSQIQGEFGGSNPISLSEYYAGGSFVPSGTSGTNGSVPSSGAIDINIFYGTSAYIAISSVDIGTDQENDTLSNVGELSSAATVTGGTPASYTYTWNYTQFNGSYPVLSATGANTSAFDLKILFDNTDEVSQWHVNCTVSDGRSSLTSSTVVWTYQTVY